MTFNFYLIGKIVIMRITKIVVKNRKIFIFIVNFITIWLKK